MVTANITLTDRLPEAHRECDHCLDRLIANMRRVDGVVEIRPGDNRRQATVIYDPEATDLAEIESACQQAGQAGCELYARRTIPIEGMHCADCAARLQTSVARLEGVNSVAVNFVAARMDLEYRDDLVSNEAIAERVAEMGYRVSEGDDAGQATSGGTLRGFLLEPALRPTLAGVGLTLIGIIALAAGAPELVPTGFFAAAALIAGVPVARSGINGLRINRQLDINFLMTIAVIGAAVLGEWLEAATVVVLFSIGEALEGFAMDRARHSIRGLMSLTPDEATVRRDGLETTMAVSEIVPGDIVVIRPGGRLPVDGVIQSGSSMLDQAPVTGESVPVERGAGDQVFSGTINGSGVIEVEATQPASNSTIARIVHMVEEAQASKAPAQRFVDVFARYYPGGSRRGSAGCSVPAAGARRELGQLVLPRPDPACRRLSLRAGHLDAGLDRLGDRRRGPERRPGQGRSIPRSARLDPCPGLRQDRYADAREARDATGHSSQWKQRTGDPPAGCLGRALLRAPSGRGYRPGGRNARHRSIHHDHDRHQHDDRQRHRRPG
ncbi:MAG: copper ion binding protein [Thermomicrobiales bacterium]